MLRKPVTFMERAVILLSASQIYSVEVGQAVGAYRMNWMAVWLFWLVFNNSWVMLECGMKSHLVTVLICISFHFACCCCGRKLGFYAVSWNKQSCPPSQESTQVGPNNHSAFVLVPKMADKRCFLFVLLLVTMGVLVSISMQTLRGCVECLHVGPHIVIVNVPLLTSRRLHSICLHRTCRVGESNC